MKRSSLVFALAALLLGMAACKNTNFKKTKEGFPYKVYSDGKGEKILPGYVVRYHQTNKLEDSVLNTTWGTPARWTGVAKDGEQSAIAKLLLEARTGDSIMVVQPIDSLLKASPQAGADSFLLANRGKQIKTIIKITEVYKNEEAAQPVFEKEAVETFYKDPAVAQQKKTDDAELNAYVSSNNIKIAKKTAWGTLIQTLAPGNGQKAKMGQYVMLRYTGKNLKGEVFDTNNKPGGQLLPVQLGAGGMILGFQDGVKELTKGEKAIIYVPSVIAYGAQGNPPAIAPNQNILFELEVVDITNAPPQAPPMQGMDTTKR